VKKLLTIVLAWASLAVMLSFVMADSFKREPGMKAEARSEDNFPVAPARNVVPPNRGIAHIIHVPQAGDRASVNSRGQSAMSNDDDDEEFAPPTRRRVAPAMQRQDDSPLRPRAPRWQPRSETPPQQESHQEQRRAVLTAASPLAEGPTPVRPIPRINSKADTADKFSQPRETRPSAPPPASDNPDGG